MQARPNDLATDRSSKAGGGHHQTVVFLGIKAHSWRRGSLSPGHLNAILCGLDIESEGTQQAHRTLNSIRFLMRCVGRAVQPSTGPQRKQGRKWREQVVGVAQVDLQRGLCGRAGRQSALVGPSDAQRWSKVGKKVAAKRVLRVRPSVELHHALRAADPQEREGRHGSISRKVHRARRLNVPGGEMHAFVAQLARPSTGFGDARREGKMQGTARLSLKTNLAVHGLERTGEKEC